MQMISAIERITDSAYNVAIVLTVMAIILGIISMCLIPVKRTAKLLRYIEIVTPILIATAVIILLTTSLLKN